MIRKLVDLKRVRRDRRGSRERRRGEMRKPAEEGKRETGGCSEETHQASTGFSRQIRRNMALNANSAANRISAVRTSRVCAYQRR